MAKQVRIDGFTVEYESGEPITLPTTATNILRDMLMHMVLSGKRDHEVVYGKQSVVFRIETTEDPRIYRFFGPRKMPMLVKLDTAGNPGGYGGTRRRRRRRRKTHRR
jgi:hypothetical protein